MSRKPYPSQRKPKKTAFSPALWARWLAEQARQDQQTQRLGAGIAEFRRSLGISNNLETQ